MGTSADQSGRTVRATQMGRLCGGNRSISRVCECFGAGKPVKVTVHHQQNWLHLRAPLGGPRNENLAVRNADTEKESHGRNINRNRLAQGMVRD